MFWIEKRRSSEALVVIVEESTHRVYISRASKPYVLLEQLRENANNPDDLQLFAVAFRLGRAQDLVKMKLKPFRLRYAWFSSEAYDYLDSVGDPSGTFLKLERFVEELFAEGNQTGKITPLDAAPAKRSPIDETLKLSPRSRSARAPGRPRGPERYDHPRRRRGRPSKPAPALEPFTSAPEPAPAPSRWTQYLARATLPSR